MNNKLILVALILQLISFAGIGQSRGDKVESIKIAYLSEKLNLDPKTAERFWPIYNQYNDELQNVVQESKRNNDSRSAEEILDQEQKAIDIKRKYNALFIKVINNDQLSQLYKSEKEFNKILIRRMNRMENKEQMRENRNEQRQQQDNPRMSPRPMQNAPQEARPMRRPMR